LKQEASCYPPLLAPPPLTPQWPTLPMVQPGPAWCHMPATWQLPPPCYMPPAPILPLGASCAPPLPQLAGPAEQAALLAACYWALAPGVGGCDLPMACPPLWLWSCGPPCCEGDEGDGPPSEVGGTRKRRARRRRRRGLPRARPTPPPELTLEALPLRSGGAEGPMAVAQGPAGWEAALHDEHRRSFVSVRRGAFAAEQLGEWWRLLLRSIGWRRPKARRPTGQERLMPRSACWLTSNGCQCTYEYGGTAFPPVPMPPWLVGVTEAVSSACGLSERPNACNMNHYEDGLEVVGWHSDDEELFQATEQDVLIMSLSLGASRTFELRPKDAPAESTKVLLHHGDLCTMEGLCQKHYRHCVPLEEDVQEARINLTWRWVLRHQPHCPMYMPEAQ